MRGRGKLNFFFVGENLHALDYLHEIEEGRRQRRFTNYHRTYDESALLDRLEFSMEVLAIKFEPCPKLEVNLVVDYQDRFKNLL